ncbi:MAG: hypothetical protein KatS3mg121_0132 [Gammaproteobacteria bacterium]|nr:MAG: hypothetical protein KatS3mg121_0132 [Gammaproteobacteria bacterium]
MLAAGPRRGHYEYGPVPAVVARKVRRLARLCRAHGVALPAAALHFARAHPAVRAVLVGFDRPRQVAQVLDWWAARPPAALWAALRLAGLVDPAAPVPEEAR